MRTKVASLFGDEDLVITTTTELNDFINEAMKQVAVDAECIRLLTSSITTTDADGLITLPTDYLRLVELRYNGVGLPQLDPQLVRNNYSTIPVGEPYGWIFYDYSKIQLWPKKASGTGLDIKLSYIALPTLLAVDGNSPNLPLMLHDAIVQYALSRLYEKVQDIQMAEYARGVYSRLIMNYQYFRDNQTVDNFASVRETDPLIGLEAW